MELSNYLVSWVATYLGDLQPTYIGVIIYLLSSMDIIVVSRFLKEIHHPFRLTHLLKPRTRPAKDSMEVRVLEALKKMLADIPWNPWWIWVSYGFL